jgi:hypothetical protein
LRRGSQCSRGIALPLGWFGSAPGSLPVPRQPDEESSDSSSPDSRDSDQAEPDGASIRGSRWSLLHPKSRESGDDRSPHVPRASSNAFHEAPATR